MRPLRLVWLTFVCLWAAGLFFIPFVRADSGHVDVLHVDGVINPVIDGYIERGITVAERDGARAVIIELNTPGGLDSSMRAIITRIINSEIPVIVYVSPPGSRAASAGAFIMQSAHVAAMAPNTSMGSAHPVFEGQNPTGSEQTGQPDQTMMDKVTNDAVSYIKGLATMRGRNVDWAERMVRESVNATEGESLQIGAIDLVAPDLPALLEAADGRQVTVPAGTVTVQTAGARIDRVDMSFTEDFLHIISDPNIAYILLFVGINALIYEMASPGAILPGVAGVICILLAFYSMGTLPINYAGIGLIVFAFILFFAEIKVQSHGVLLVGGIISMLLGSMIMMNAGAPYLSVSLPTVIATVGATTGFFIFVIGKAAAALRRPATTGREGLIGSSGEARTDIAPEGTVFALGELWSAASEDGPIPRGSKVLVVGISGLKLVVRKV